MPFVLVDAGVTRFEEHFLAHFMTPSGETVFEKIAPQYLQLTKGPE
tara:strand:- start:1171 stop:1308 length:138 start_codon:yes stop_codon:yes gene_type:complete